MHVLIDLFTRLQLWLFEALVQPALFAIGGASLLEDAYAATAWFLVGVMQIMVLLVVIGPLQRWRPVEAVRDRATVRVDVLIDVMLVVMAQLIGVAPEQFIAIVALTQLSESLQHANVRLAFGRWGERLWVSPRFHRAHHSVGTGHESFAAGQTPVGAPKRLVLGGHNFGVLLPWWDMLFGTANLQSLSAPTGVRDQIEAQRDYGRGLWAQQWFGCKRLFGRA